MHRNIYEIWRLPVKDFQPSPCTTNVGKGTMDRQFEFTIEKEFFSNIIVNTIDGQFITC